MRYAKTLMPITLMLATFGIAAATANATETSLPSFLTLPAVENFEFEASSLTGLSKFTGIQNIESEGYKFNAAANNMGELGILKMWLLNWKLGKTECTTTGDAAPNVLFEAEYHLVLALKGANTLFGLLILLPVGGVTIKCGVVTLKILGSMLLDISTAGNTEVTAISTETGACTGNTPAFSEYDNMAGSMTHAELKSEVGGIKGKSCEEIAGTTTFNSTATIELMEP